MSIGIVHGYFLGDSGSAVYVRELSRELVRQGHDVTLVCQEDAAAAREYDFIDSCFELDETNRELTRSFERDGGYEGSCRLVRPHLAGRLLTYVAGPFAGYEAVTFQDADDDRIAEYIDRNITALGVIFARWRPDFVQANHLVMQPYLVRTALAGRAPYIVTIHGSALNFTARKDPRMVPYAVDGLEGASAIGTLSETSSAEVTGFAAGHGADIAAKIVRLPPGVDTGLMRPGDEGDRAVVLGSIAPGAEPERDAVAVFAGRLLWTKGIHYAVAALPLVLQQWPHLQLIIVGDGPMAAPLRELIRLLDEGDVDGARELLAKEPELRAGDSYGPVLPDLDSREASDYAAAARGKLSRRIHFTGHLPHERLAPIYAAADISLAISVFPEAFALVSIEALAAGAIPLVTYQTGLIAAADVAADELDDPQLRRLVPGGELTGMLARAIPYVLETYPTRDPGFRGRLNAVADRLFSWNKVASRYIELSGNGVKPDADG